MKIVKQLPDIVRNISGKDFFYFYFLKVHISLSLHGPHLKPYICIGNIGVEGTVSQIVYRSWFIFYKILKIIFKKMNESKPFFCIK